MKIKTAMLLAAGRGERLAPLTHETPKPLLPVHGKPLIVHHLERLKKLGIEKVVINICYLAPKIIETLGHGERFGLTIEYSPEEKLLGAGGGIRQALPLLGEEPFLLISSDIWTDFPFEHFFAESWSLEENLIHAVLTHKADTQKGDFDLIHGQLRLSEKPEYIYASIAVIHPAAFSAEPPGFSGIMPAFSKAIQAQKATGEYYKNFYNINTVEDYQKL